MKCMRTLTFVVSSFLLFSVQAFAGYGNFGTIVKAAQDSENIANISNDPSSTQSAVWNSDCNDKKTLLHQIVAIDGSELNDVQDEMEKKFFSGVGALVYIDATGKTISKGSAFVFRERGSPDFFVGANAHEVYDKNNWTFGKKADGSPDPDNMYFYSDVCKQTYKAKPNSLKVGTKEVDINSRNQATQVRAKDWLVFKLTEKPCDKMQAYEVVATPTAKATAYKNIQVAGLYSNGQKSQMAGVETNRAESPQATNANTGKIKKLYSLCSAVGTEGSGKESLVYHQCSTNKGGSGGPILVVGSDGKPKVIGIHRGVSDPSWSSNANEGVLITPELLSAMTK